VRGGTAKLLTLFRPATGEVRAQPVTATPNVVLHPWLRECLTAIIEDLPPLPGHAAVAQAARAAWATWQEGARPPPRAFRPHQAARAAWATWQEGRSVRFTLLDDLPPLRVLLVLDNLSGHKTPELVCWLMAHGIMPLYTPLGGSWLNMAESVQRILVRRALDGQHPTTAQQVMDWLGQAVRGWNAGPTPFVWGGKRAARRGRASQRRHQVGGSGACTRRPLRRLRRAATCSCKGYVHAK